MSDVMQVRLHLSGVRVMRGGCSGVPPSNGTAKAGEDHRAG